MKAFIFNVGCCLVAEAVILIAWQVARIVFTAFQKLPPSSCTCGAKIVPENATGIAEIET